MQLTRVRSTVYAPGTSPSTGFVTYTDPVLTEQTGLDRGFTVVYAIRAGATPADFTMWNGTGHGITGNAN